MKGGDPMDEIKEINENIEYSIEDMEDINNKDEIVDIEEIEDQSETNNNFENIKLLLDSPLGNTLIKKGVSLVLQSMLKNYIRNSVINKSTNYLVNDIISTTYKRDMSNLKRKKYKGNRKIYKNEIIPRRQSIVENKFKNIIIQNLGKIL